MKTRVQQPEQRIEEMLPVLRTAVYRNCPEWMRNSVDDLVQEAAIRMLEMLRRNEGKQAYSSSYLWRTAYSVVIDEIRRRRRRKEQSLEQECHDPATTSGDPERMAAGESMGRAVRDCLSRLAEARKRAVVLRLLGHGVREISSLLDFSYKRAENLVYRGMAQLRSCLEGKGVRP